MRTATIYVSKPKPPVYAGFLLPPGTYWRLKWDEQIGPENVVRPSAYNQNGGTPATRVPKDSDFIEFDEPHQKWLIEEVWCNMCHPSWRDEYLKAPDEKKIDTMIGKKFAAWSHSKLAWFNHENGSDVRAVYPLLLNLKKPSGLPNTPIAQQMLGSAGNLVMQSAPEFTDNRVTWIPCKALRPDELIPWEELKWMPWVMNLCTVQRSRELEANGIHRVNPFDHLTTVQDEVFDVPLILTTHEGVIYFDKNMLLPVPAGSRVPCPYNPYRKFGRALDHWN